jgi:3-methyl-2-oxobutanoate hydroxymethyltransferase
MSEATSRKKLTIRDLRSRKAHGEPIAVATAFDYVTTKLVEEGEIDVVLVSDWAVATTLLGYPSALHVKWDEVLFYLKAVARLVQYAFVVGAMPFGSYNVSDVEAVRNASLFMKAGADAVKLEGAGQTVDRIRAISRTGTICVAHLGATAHQEKQLSGLHPVGQTAAEAAQLVEDAQLLVEAGAFALILEGMPERVAEVIREKTEVITFGAGGTPGCDGQMLTTHSILGMPEAVLPLFSRHYADFYDRMLTGVNAWAAEVRGVQFPTAKQTFTIADAEFERFLDMIG